MHTHTKQRARPKTLKQSPNGVDKTAIWPRELRHPPRIEAAAERRTVQEVSATQLSPFSKCPTRDALAEAGARGSGAERLMLRSTLLRARPDAVRSSKLRPTRLLRVAGKGVPGELVPEVASRPCRDSPVNLLSHVLFDMQPEMTPAHRRRSAPRVLDPEEPTLLAQPASLPNALDPRLPVAPEPQALGLEASRP